MRRSFAPDTSELARLRRWVFDLIGDDSASDQLHLFLVAVTEVATNAIEAHTRRSIDADIEVVLDRRARLLAIQDRGGGQVGRLTLSGSVPAPTSLRGRGLAIVRSICPRANFLDTDDGLRVELPFPDDLDRPSANR